MYRTAKIGLADTPKATSGAAGHDVLAQELGQHRIDKAQYAAGRRLEALFATERGHLRSAWSHGDRVDQSRSTDRQHGGAIDRMRRHAAMTDQVRAVVGDHLEDLHAILTDCVSLKEYADTKGITATRDYDFLARSFRWCLRRLADKDLPGEVV